MEASILGRTGCKDGVPNEALKMFHYNYLPNFTTHYSDIACNSNVNSGNNTILLNSSSGVINLSSYQLSDSELSLLSKGLTFVSTPPSPDSGILFEDLNKFHTSIKRKLAIDKFTLDQTAKPADPSITNNIPFGNTKFKNLSTWNPPGPPIVEHMCFQNEVSLENSTVTKSSRANLRKAEFDALRSLKSNTNIIIKKADKGSAIVIQDRADYITEGLKQLNDVKFYKSVPLDLTNKHKEMVSLQVSIMLKFGEISQKCAEYLTLETPRTANFYLLPKIHKGIIPPPGRPIVSANDCPTERISQFVDHFIQPLVPKLKSYVRDSGHLLCILNNLELPQNTILCTLDVSSLYTNIPNKEGIEAVRQALSQTRDPLENPTNHSICNLLNLVLTCNNFQFDNKHYLQIGGTAMGTKLAPSFANIFMGWFEENFVYHYHKQPLIWKRYIDDIFIVWQHGPDTLTDFVKHLNTCHETIKFTQESSTESINFLDITVSIDKTNRIVTSLYSKPTDSHNYLLYSSEHPRHILKGIPYSQFLRVRRICSNILDFRQSALMLSSHFIRRGYPKHLVKSAMTRAELKDRDTLLLSNTPGISKTIESPQTNSELTFYLVTTHNPSNPPIRKIVETNWALLSKSKTTRPLENAKIIFGQRRNKIYQTIWSGHLLALSRKRSLT